jgi:hypothetical protein
VSLAQRESPGRFPIWREVLGNWWVALSAALSALAVTAFHFGWKIPGFGQRVGAGWAWLLLALVALLAGVLEGAQRAVARREREVEAQRQEIERLIRTPQRRLAEAKYHLYRDAFMCTQLVGFLMMTKMEGSAMTPETALSVERGWGSEFLERIRRMFGTGRSGDVFSNRMGGVFPPPRDQAMAIYVGLADYLRLLAERITESDLDPEYLHGPEKAPEPTSAGPAVAEAAGAAAGEA